MYHNHKLQCIRCQTPILIKEWRDNKGFCNECKEMYEQGGIVKEEMSHAESI